MSIAASPVKTTDTPATAPSLRQSIISPTGLAMALALALPFVGLYWFWFWTQGQHSWGSGDWSHAFFVPVISAYILWQNRAKISACPREVFWPGLILLMLAVPSYIQFQIGGSKNHMGQGLSMILGLLGVTLLTCGPKLTRHLFLPIAYLVFGITISEIVMIRVTFTLQNWASQGAYVLLNMLTISTSVDGNTLTITKSDGTLIPLNVAQACSGMRMVIAFMALGAAVALVGVKHWWQRTALLLLAVPVAILMNIVRVAVLGIGSLYNPEFAKGEAHMFIGTALLVPAFLLYMGIVWALNRVLHEPPEPKAGAGVEWVAPGRVDWRFVRRPEFVVPFVVLVISAVGLRSTVSAIGAYLTKLPIQPAGNLQVRAAVPTQTRSWKQVGQDLVYSAEMVEELGTSNYITRDYEQKTPDKGKSPQHLSLHVAYYTGMIDTVPHVADRCMTGAGYQLVSSASTVPVPLDTSAWIPDPDAGQTGQGMTYRVAPDPLYSLGKTNEPRRLPRGLDKLTMRVSQFEGKGISGKQTVGYFFLANGGFCDSAEEVRTLAFKLTDTYAYYMKVQISSVQVANEKELAQLSGSLLDELLPELIRAVPDWVEVEQGNYPADNPRRVRKAGAEKHD